MSICLATLVLNEMEWLLKLYEQHKDWPGLARWIFVESADTVYAQTNPSLVSPNGLSTDGTTEWLEQLARTDGRVIHVKHGISSASDPAQGKCQSRQRYLDEMEAVRPEFFFVVDADEFYTKTDQERLADCLNRNSRSTAWVCKHRDIWHPASIQSEPLFRYEVTGGFWSIPYCRCWRWKPNLRYITNHNTPEVNGVGLDSRLARLDNLDGQPEFIHMGFASDPVIRAAKNRYYAARGEAVDKKRSWYCDSRACFETWKPNDKLPRGAKVCLYDGPIPECFQGESQ